jgi:hypothetical protein
MSHQLDASSGRMTMVRHMGGASGEGGGSGRWANAAALVQHRGGIDYGPKMGPNRPVVLLLIPPATTSCWQSASAVGGRTPPMGYYVAMINNRSITDLPHPS